MCASAVRSYVVGPLVICVATTISAALLGMSARAAEKPGDLPRYRLKPGQELHYVEHHDYVSGKGDRAIDRSATAKWSVWVTRSNPDGSWRVVIHTAEWYSKPIDAALVGKEPVVGHRVIKLGPQRRRKDRRN